MITNQRKRYIEKMSPGQRDAEIIDAISDMNSEGGRALGQPRTVTFDDTPQVALADVEATGVTFYNDTGKTVNVYRGAGTVPYVIPDGYGKTIDVQANANELSVKNATDATSVTMTYEVIGEDVDEL